jgi:hypothetical protein
MEDKTKASEAHRIGLAAFGVGLTMGVLVIGQIAIN